MPAHTPQYTLARSQGQGGVLPTSATSTNTGPREDSVKNAAVRNKVVLRRLPPGLTSAELGNALGDEWKPGQGRINWASFKPGKPSKDPAKPSKPSRAYFQVANHTHLEPLSQKVKSVSFTDARGTANGSALAGPPVLEFATYQRVPAGRRKEDVRQGTIDQDPEFIEFLESLTNPITKPKLLDATSDQIANKDNNNKITPLIQHLREKKAAAKDKTAQGKAAKHNKKPSKEGNIVEAKLDKKVSPQPKEEADTSADKRAGRKVDKSVPKEASKAPRKERMPDPPKPLPTQPANREQRESSKDVISKKQDSPAIAAARLIQRDLGIRGGRGAGARRGAMQTSPEAKGPVPSAPATVNGGENTKPNNIPTAPKAVSSAPTGPTVGQNKPSRPQGTVNNTPSTQPKPPTGPSPKPPVIVRPTPPGPVVNPTASRAFLKHANPSQGITEQLLSVALSPFGQVKFVEIDKRKGFAYVDFAAPAGLQAAIAASPVRVAQGSVQVLERRDRTAPGAMNGSPAGAPPTKPASMGVPPAAMAPRGRGGMGPGGGFRGGRGGRARGGGFGRGGNFAAVALNGAATVNGATASPTTVNTQPAAAADTPSKPAAEATGKVVDPT